MERISAFQDETQDVIWDAEAQDDYSGILIGDWVLERHDDYRYYGCDISGQVIRLNFYGTSDWCYGCIVTDENYENQLDQYPIYLIEFDTCKISKAYNNFAELAQEVMETHDISSNIIFSSNMILQEIPTMISLTLS